MKGEERVGTWRGRGGGRDMKGKERGGHGGGGEGGA